MKQFKKIIFAFLLAIIFGAGAAKVTRALLQDTEESLGNTVTGASINLKVGDDDPSTFSFNFNNVTPGEIHQLWVAVAKDTAGVGGNFWLEVSSSNSLELNNPEGETDTVGEGELDDCAEVQLIFDDNLGTEILALPFTPVNEIGSVDMGRTEIDTLVDGGARMNLQLRTDSCGSESMGDAFDLDLIFHLDQV
jgi:hypothetical protein